MLSLDEAENKPHPETLSTVCGLRILNLIEDLCHSLGIGA